MIEAEPSMSTFQQHLQHIDAHYDYTPTHFRNGCGADALDNAAGVNEGSCKIFAYARLQGLDEAATLALFGEHYAQVCAHPDGSDHANIRRFMRDGWACIAFSAAALQRRAQP